MIIDFGLEFFYHGSNNIYRVVNGLILSRASTLMKMTSKEITLTMSLIFKIMKLTPKKPLKKT